MKNRSILDRLEALEQRQARPFRIIWRNDGETTEQAKAREGVRPGDRIVVIGWLGGDPEAIVRRNSGDYE